MKTSNALLCAILAGATASSVAYSLPSAEKYGTYIDFDQNNGDNPTVFQDSDDQDLYYVPYDEVTVMPRGTTREGRPKFGLAYDRYGGLLGMTVRARYSQTTIDYVKAMGARIEREEDRKIRLSPLTPVAGHWAFTMTDNGNTVFLGTPTNVDTVTPNADVAMNAVLTKDAIRYVAYSYQTGAGLGVNYNYKFRAVLTPMQLKANIHWRNFRAIVQNETRINTETQISGSGNWGPFSAKSEFNFSSAWRIRSLVQLAVERQVVRIWYRSGGEGSNAELDRRMIDEVTKIVLAKQFKPVSSQFKLLEADEPTATCGGGSRWRFGGSVKSCHSIGTSYLWNSEVIFENSEYEYHVTSETIDRLPGAVGSNFGYMCSDYPDTFVNVRTGATGCPVFFPEDDSSNMRTEKEPGQPAAKDPKPENEDKEIQPGEGSAPTDWSAFGN